MRPRPAAPGPGGNRSTAGSLLAAGAILLLTSLLAHGQPPTCDSYTLWGYVNWSQGDGGFENGIGGATVKVYNPNNLNNILTTTTDAIENSEFRGLWVVDLGDFNPTECIQDGDDVIVEAINNTYFDRNETVDIPLAEGSLLMENLTHPDPVTISTTLDGVPIDFGNLPQGSVNRSAINGSSGFPSNVTVEASTNTWLNLSIRSNNTSLNRTTSPSASWVVTNISYGNHSEANTTSNTTHPQAMNLTTAYTIPSFGNWSRMRRGNYPGLGGTGGAYNRSIYFFVSIPTFQRAGNYTANVSFNISEYIP